MTESRHKLARLAQHWTREQSVVAAYISSLVPDFHDAEDVLGRVAAALVVKADSYDPARPFVPWALGIARREILAYRRRTARDRHVFDEQVMRGLEEACERLLPEWEARKEAIAHCVGTVSPRAKQMLELRYVRGLEPAQIARTLNLEPGSVRVMLHKIRAALRQCIEKRLAAEMDR